MIPHHVYYQFAILGLLWLYVILHSAWPSRCATSHPRPADPVPITCKRKRSNEPKPFEGLTHKPPCAACEHNANYPTVPPPRRPDPMPSTNRHPRTIDTSISWVRFLEACFGFFRGVIVAAMSDYRHKRPNVSVLMSPSVCPAQYRRVIFDAEVDTVRKDVCFDIAKR